MQGFGNAGSVAAKLFHRAGAEVIGLSDSQGGIVNFHGWTPRPSTSQPRDRLGLRLRPRPRR